MTTGEASGGQDRSEVGTGIGRSESKEIKRKGEGKWRRAVLKLHEISIY